MKMCACIHLFHLAVGMISACIVAVTSSPHGQGSVPGEVPGSTPNPQVPKKALGCPARCRGDGASSLGWVFPHLPAPWEVPGKAEIPCQQDVLCH